MDLVLGVSTGPAVVRMVLVEGENADGALIEEDSLDLASDGEQATASVADQVVSIILGTREGAGEAGHRLLATGVAWADPLAAAALRAALAAGKIENVMLVSAFLAAAALAQNAGAAMGYTQTAMLFVEPDAATVGIIDCHDGAVSQVRRKVLCREDGRAIAELAALVSDIEVLDSHPEGLFVVGGGVDIASLMPAVEAATWLPVSIAEEPQTALARGAALAAANAPLFVSSTAALAYAQDPGTGVVNRYLPAGYVNVLDVSAGGEPTSGDLAYSAMPSEDVDADVTGIDAAGDGVFDPVRGHRPLLLAGTVLAVIAVTAVVALEIALSIGIRPTVALRPTPGQELIVPDHQAPASESVSPGHPQQPTHLAMNRPPVPAGVAAPPAPRPAALPPPPAVAPAAPVPAAAPPVPMPLPVPVLPPAVSVPRAGVPIPAAPPRIPAPPPPGQRPDPQPPIRVSAPSVPVTRPPAQPSIPLVRTPAPPVPPSAPPIRGWAPSAPAQDPTLPGFRTATDPPVRLPGPRPPAPFHMPLPQPPLVHTSPVPAAPGPPPIFAPRMQVPALRPGGAFGGGVIDHGPSGGIGWGLGGRGFGGGFVGHR
ncbi:MAG: hypothetical protein QJR12_17345 [Mycobacterium sp.]|uniref:DUF7159 family protein n=1 Tax=Mycobacterium sp. TaxID=1785 RepID=UPI00262EC170|nr:hypothetical protein [Mycobacterium sp.]MDI3315962.1 hypothetical protein [Mycobacterium sp.]